MITDFTGDMKEIIEIKLLFIPLKGDFLFFYVGLFFLWDGCAWGEVFVEVFD
jgi:hypothetical protein